MIGKYSMQFEGSKKDSLEELTAKLKSESPVSQKQKTDMLQAWENKGYNEGEEREWSKRTQQRLRGQRVGGH